MPTFTYSANGPQRATLRKCGGQNNQMSSHNIHSFRIWPLTEALSINHIMFSALEIRMNPHCYDKFPMPWDAGFELTDDGLTLEGSAGPCGFGSALVMLSRDDYLRISEAEEKEKPFWIIVDITLTQAAVIEGLGWEVKGAK